MTFEANQGDSDAMDVGFGYSRQHYSLSFRIRLLKAKTTRASGKSIIQACSAVKLFENEQRKPVDSFVTRSMALRLVTVVFPEKSLKSPPRRIL